MKWIRILLGIQLLFQKDERRVKNGHHSFVIWFTGLSASGKSTVANAIARKLFEKNIGNYVLDGDNIRHGLNKDLGFLKVIVWKI